MTQAIALFVCATVAFVLGWKFRTLTLQPRGIDGAVDDVGEFHYLCHVPEMPTPMFPHPSYAKRVTREARRNFLKEEYEEYEKAEDENNMVEIADALADIVYIAIGTARCYGIPFDRVWNEVQRSNMAKRWPDGVAHIRADGKVLKPPGWTAPDIQVALYGDIERRS